MWNIRKDQKDQFLLHDEDELIGFIADHVRSESPELVGRLSDESLRGMVASGVARARGHGLRSPEDLTSFVSVMFEIAPNFDKQPEIARTLADARYPPETRYQRIFTEVSARAWEEAEEAYDPDEWHPEVKEGGDPGSGRGGGS